MIGFVLQVFTVFFSLLTTWLLSKKGKERYGYLIGFLSLPLWILMELYYRQYFYLILNPLYFVLWFKGLKNHWSYMKIDKKFGHPIEIEWIDACGADDVWQSVDDASTVPDDVYTFTRGWYVSHDKEFIVVCRDKGKTKDYDIGGVLCIPIGSIKEIK